MFFRKSHPQAEVVERPSGQSSRERDRSSNRKENAVDERISNIATASIALSKLAPRLATLAAEMAEGASLQARESTQIASQANAMSQELEEAINSLKLDSDKVGGIVGSIRKLADQSKILAVNASIEAANAGAMGRAFGAVAVEVESLAGRTAKATDDVSGKISMIEKSIQRAVTAAGLENESKRKFGEADERQSIRGIGTKVDSIATVARQNSSSAIEVAEAGREVESLCENLLLTVGKFRIQAHERAARIFNEIACQSVLSTLSQLKIERLLQDKIERFPMFELFYLTNIRGEQVVENIWQDSSLEREKALGKNWSNRDWFLEAKHAGGETRISDIYHSVATGSFCFTLSKLICDAGGEPVGVLAADVNFGTLMDF